MLVRGDGPESCRNAQPKEANTPAGTGHIVETSAGEQVVATIRAATEGGSQAATAVGENVAASANDEGW